MVDDATNSKYKFDLNSYKQFLIEDFQRNKDIAELAHALSFTDAPSMEAWVKGIEGDDFYYYTQALPFIGVVPEDLITYIKGIQYQAKYFVHEEENLYQFFSKREYQSYEELIAGINNYYVYNISFFKRIDGLLFAKLMAEDVYSKMPKGKGLHKQFKENVFLKLIPQKYTKHSEIPHYSFSEIVLEIDKKDFRLLDRSDFRTLLLLMGDSFIVFYRIYSIFSKPGDIPESVSVKNDEPISKMDESKFILTNSESKLKIFNKYIYLTLELYYHYFKVLEKYIAATV